MLQERVLKRLKIKSFDGSSIEDGSFFGLADFLNREIVVGRSVVWTRLNLSGSPSRGSGFSWWFRPTVRWGRAFGGHMSRLSAVEAEVIISASLFLFLR